MVVKENNQKLKLKTLYEMLLLVSNNTFSIKDINDKMGKCVTNTSIYLTKMYNLDWVYFETHRVNTTGTFTRFIIKNGTKINVLPQYHKRTTNFVFLTDKGQQLLKDLDSIKYIFEYIC